MQLISVSLYGNCLQVSCIDIELGALDFYTANLYSIQLMKLLFVNWWQKQKQWAG